MKLVRQGNHDVSQMTDCGKYFHQYIGAQGKKKGQSAEFLIKLNLLKIFDF